MTELDCVAGRELASWLSDDPIEFMEELGILLIVMKKVKENTQHEHIEREKTNIQSFAHTRHSSILRHRNEGTLSPRVFSENTIQVAK